RRRRRLRERAPPVRKAHRQLSGHRPSARRRPHPHELGAHADLVGGAAAARKRDLEGPCPLEASMAKLFATNMAGRVANAAMQTAGALGYEADSHFVRRLLEARG